MRAHAREAGNEDCADQGVSGREAGYGGIGQWSCWLVWSPNGSRGHADLFWQKMLAAGETATGGLGSSGSRVARRNATSGNGLAGDPSFWDLSAPSVRLSHRRLTGGGWTGFLLEQAGLIRTGWILVAIVVGLASGCRLFHAEAPAPGADGQPLIANPLPVGPIDRSVIMDEVSDELDNYFRIAREERVRLMDGLLTEGWIETHPQIGSTCFEPWRRDSVRGFERLHATLQTVRRFAKARIIPTGDGYLIDLRVFKELEDLPNPNRSPVASRQFRHDNALDVDREDLMLLQPNQGWIPQGRDLALEQAILQKIQARLQKCQSR